MPVEKFLDRASIKGGVATRSSNHLRDDVPREWNADA